MSLFLQPIIIYVNKQFLCNTSETKQKSLKDRDLIWKYTSKSIWVSKLQIIKSKKTCIALFLEKKNSSKLLQEKHSIL